MKRFAAIKALIFDMDGVLLDSSSSHARAYEQVFSEIGITGVDYSSLAGRRTDEALAEIFLARGMTIAPEAVASWVTRKRELAYGLLERNILSMPSPKDLLQGFSGKYALALATSTTRRNAELFLRSTETAPCFKFVICGEEVRRAKPDPEIYLAVLKNLKVAASEAVVIEDAVSGIKAARAAGIATFGLVGTCTEEQLRGAGADILIQDLSEMARFL